MNKANKKINENADYIKRESYLTNNEINNEIITETTKTYRYRRNYKGKLCHKIFVADGRRSQ